MTTTLGFIKRTRDIVDDERVVAPIFATGTVAVDGVAGAEFTVEEILADLAGVEEIFWQLLLLLEEEESCKRLLSRRNIFKSEGLTTTKGRELGKPDEDAEGFVVLVEVACVELSKISPKTS